MPFALETHIAVRPLLLCKLEALLPLVLLSISDKTFLDIPLVYEGCCVTQGGQVLLVLHRYTS